MPLSSAETPVLIIPSNPSLLLVKIFISNAPDVIRGLNLRREPQLASAAASPKLALYNTATAFYSLETSHIQGPFGVPREA